MLHKPSTSTVLDDSGEVVGSGEVFEVTDLIDLRDGFFNLRGARGHVFPLVRQRRQTTEPSHSHLAKRVSFLLTPRER